MKPWYKRLHCIFDKCDMEVLAEIPMSFTEFHIMKMKGISNYASSPYDAFKSLPVENIEDMEFYRQVRICKICGYVDEFDDLDNQRF